MQISRRRLIITAGVAMAAAGGGAYMLLPPGLAPSLVFAPDGIAINGTDPVAYFTARAPIPGKPEFSHDWNGARWHFASAENRDLFAADPAAYAPQYGGFCAWAVAAKGKLYSTQPGNWAIVGDKLYLNYSDGIQKKWNADRAGFIARGDRRWPDLQPVS